MKKPPEPDHSSPKFTFVALFSDGIVTRMATHCENGKFNLGRGLALSVAAYDSRVGKTPPAIVAAKFGEPGYNDTVLKEYDAKALGEQQTKQQNKKVHEIHDPSAPTMGDPT